MIDIHNHIVYGVDDGSRSLAESMKMVDLFIKAGFREIIATSHFDRSRYMVAAKDIDSKVDIINEEIRKIGLDFKVYKGHEIQIEPNSLDMISKGELLKLADSRYVLFELPFINEPIFLKDLIYRSQLEGLVPIIAHAERYAYVKRNVDYLLEFIKMGALIQCNYSSIISSKDTLTQMLKRNMVDILATDAHQSEWRSPDITKYKNEIIDIIGEDKFDILSRVNPLKIIADEFISSSFDEIINPNKKKKSFFSFWRRK